MTDDGLTRFHCQKCGKRLKAPPSRAGQQFACPRCGTPLAIPFAEDDDNTALLGELEMSPQEQTRLGEHPFLTNVELLSPQPSAEQPSSLETGARARTGFAKPEIVNAIAFAIVGAIVAAPFAYLTSQYFPVFGSFFHQMGEPFSRARKALIPRAIEC